MSGPTLNEKALRMDVIPFKRENCGRPDPMKIIPKPRMANLILVVTIF
jgi:hypothetical protein